MNDWAGGFHQDSPAAGIAMQWTGNQLKDREAVREVHSDMKRMTWKQASVVHMHRWPQYVSGYLHHDLVLPAAPVATDESVPRIVANSGHLVTFTQHIYPTYLVVTRPTESGDLTAKSVLPLELACDFIGQHSAQNECGGYFCYESAESLQTVIDSKELIACIPSQTISNVADMERMTVRDAFEAAHARQIAAYLKMADVAQANYDSVDKIKRKAITSTYRKVGKALFEWGILAKEPLWTEVSRTNTTPPILCPMCSAEAKPNAIRCTNGGCTHIYKPFDAFRDGLIDLQTPGAELSLRRLSRKELEELEIYPAVLPLDEYKKEQVLKAKRKDKEAK